MHNQVQPGTKKCHGSNIWFISVGNSCAIHKKLNFDPDHSTTIKIVSGGDAICAQCPEKQGDLCNYESKVTKMDHIYLNTLQLKIGQIITLEDLKVKVKENLSMEKFQQTCKACSWYPLNIPSPNDFSGFSTDRPEQFGFRQGGEEQATGVY